MTKATNRVLIMSAVGLAFAVGIAFADTFRLSIPSQVVKADKVLTSTSDFLGAYFDEALSQPVLSLDFGEISDRGCGTKVPKLFIKNQSEVSLTNIAPDAPVPFGFASRPFFEAQFVAQRAGATPYDGGVVAPGEVITMYVWVCDTQGEVLPPDPQLYDDLELRLNAETVETPQE